MFPMPAIRTASTERHAGMLVGKAVYYSIGMNAYRTAYSKMPSDATPSTKYQVDTASPFGSGHPVSNRIRSEGMLHFGGPWGGGAASGALSGAFSFQERAMASKLIGQAISDRAACFTAKPDVMDSSNTKQSCHYSFLFCPFLMLMFCIWYVCTYIHTYIGPQLRILL